jgi:hypothetical protein
MGKRSGKKALPEKRDREEYWRLVKKAGGAGQILHQWIMQAESARPEDCDNGILPGLIYMEQQFWGPERAARRAAKGIKHKWPWPPTREEHIRWFVRELIRHGAKSVGNNEEATVHRLVSKVRKAVDKIPE